MGTNTETNAAKGDMTDEELAGLTEEERAGLLEGEDDEDGGEGAAVAEELKAGTDDGKAKEPDPKAGKTEEEAIEEEAPRVDPLPILKSGDVPTNADDRLKEIKATKAEIATKLDDGEITSRQYQEQIDALSEEAEGIRMALFKDNLSKEAAQQQELNDWQKDVTDFLGDHPEIRKNPLVYQAFDSVVREITADDANAKLTNVKQLQKAYGIWADQLGIKTATPAAKAQEKPRREVPPTLAKVPAAEAADVDDGKYAHLDRLMETDPIGFEKAMMKLSDADREAYEASL